MENKNFISVQVCNKYLPIKRMTENSTLHLQDRSDRLKTVTKLNEFARVNKVFLVDKGHKDGAELHVVYNTGIIYIFNANTYRFITALLARKNQVIRLYNKCGLRVSQDILRYCDSYVRNNMNI